MNVNGNILVDKVYNKVSILNGNSVTSSNYSIRGSHDMDLSLYLQKFQQAQVVDNTRIGFCISFDVFFFFFAVSVHSRCSVRLMQHS
jgi:hypothetical protein